MLSLSSVSLLWQWSAMSRHFVCAYQCYSGDPGVIYLSLLKWALLPNQTEFKPNILPVVLWVVYISPSLDDETLLVVISFALTNATLATRTWFPNTKELAICFDWQFLLLDLMITILWKPDCIDADIFNSRSSPRLFFYCSNTTKVISFCNTSAAYTDTLQQQQIHS